MSPIPKAQILGTDANKLIPRSTLVGRAVLPLHHLVKPKRLELVWVLENLRVAGDGVGGGLNDDPGGDGLACGEADGTAHLALEDASAGGVETEGFLEETVELFHGLQGVRGHDAVV